MPNWIKVIAAILLLPFCVGITNALIRVVGLSGQAESVWVALTAGFACWLVVYLLLPKPMLLYVFGHELTHAIWTWLFGGRVKRFKATSKGGRVVVTKTNFLIALAPYFFPIYALGVILVFAAGNLVWGWRGDSPYFHLLLGAAYGFHVTLTWHVLKARQTDITDHGFFFSAVIIWITNVGILLLGISVLTKQVGVLTALSWCWIETGKVLERVRWIF